MLWLTGSRPQLTFQQKDLPQPPHLKQALISSTKSLCSLVVSVLALFLRCKLHEGAMSAQHHAQHTVGSQKIEFEEGLCIGPLEFKSQCHHHSLGV